MKNFKKIVALILCLALVVSMTACQTQTTTQQQGTSTPAQTEEENKEEVFEDTISWDAEYDVIVVGYGMAGAATSIQAAEKGAKVLLLEKAPKGEEGGNSKYAGQGFVTVEPENRDKALEYFKRIRGKYNTPEDDVLAAFTDTIITNADWINSLGGNAIVSAKAIGEFRDIEGWDLMNAWGINGKFFDAGAYNFLHSVVEKSDLIDVWYEAPGEQLIQDPETKIIHGVVAGVEGKKYNIRAKNGVVLCTGGFENNQQMIQDYLQLPYGYSKGALYNTGDGIKMAMEVGADLWHMGNIAGPDLNAIDKTTGRSYGYAIQGEHPLLSTKFTLGNVIFVGADGTRFVDESVSTGHGFIDFHGMKLRMPVSLPAYCVFDSTAINTTIYHAWGDDKTDEIDQGIIIEADTLDELAEKLELPAGSLASTVKQYNEFCANGEDIQFGRHEETLNPLNTTGPYYAFEVVPTFTNTQGGPRRDAEGRILDTNGTPIPHLYSAGELGAIWGDIYQGAGNLSECISFGRISGIAAAAVKDDVTQKSVMDGITPVNFKIKASQTFETSANEYIGVGSGMGGNLTVKVTMDGKKIVSVEILSQNETKGISDPAIEKIPSEIVEAQSTEVDTVSGATTTSKAIIQAVTDALSKVKQ
jgi:succinate dehydrogenase/fumarate reductase flavoprotein subunit